LMQHRSVTHQIGYMHHLAANIHQCVACILQLFVDTKKCSSVPGWLFRSNEFCECTVCRPNRYTWSCKVAIYTR
jgi:peptide methionine sulfoxide reductase MsrB